ncbi:hypothetical protein VFPPC_16194 [Pochonia chlamydosporia 170]|uniref:Uncharacterized protein n=1 Tax=Pochonia chlamydosporia 170 TaxID=1380566 RepID=A0A179FGA4_METCM|nr:hypothetical protein VFPPC_16194 [Pochonia chlamydosporia 170]OAQ64281.2 hypothetical protein VFPPC_16194 [Pochonia chlamydosporia 170]
MALTHDVNHQSHQPCSVPHFVRGTNGQYCLHIWINLPRNGKVRVVSQCNLVVQPIDTRTRTETQLPNHDLEFPVQGSANRSGTFRMVLISTQNVDTNAIARNLSHLSKHSVGKRGVVLLMQGHDAMSSFMHIQLQYVYESSTANALLMKL